MSPNVNPYKDLGGSPNVLLGSNEVNNLELQEEEHKDNLSVNLNKSQSLKDLKFVSDLRKEYQDTVSLRIENGHKNLKLNSDNIKELPMKKQAEALLDEINKPN